MKSILIIIPYQAIYPPMNGGMQRCFHILHQLAVHFEVTTIIFQDKESFSTAIKEFPAISKVKIYSVRDEPDTKDVFSLLPKKFEQALRYRWIKKSWKETADGNFLQYYALLKKLLTNNVYDAVILENLATINAVTTIRNYAGNAKIIYDSHNVDSKLGAMAVKKFGMKKEYLAGIKYMEENMQHSVDALFTCSNEDRKDFLEMNNGKISIAVIPNGVSIGKQYDDGVQMEEPDSIIFCGSLNSAPNSEGLLWFYNNCWHQVKQNIPRLKLLVVGSGKAPDYLMDMYEDDSIVFSGAVEDVKPWYNKAAVVIVPLLTGSGTRLKVLEGMSLGVPVISTALGAEGIECTNEKDIQLFDEPIQFSNGLSALLKDKNKRIFLKNNARKLVEEKYDWNVMGEKMKDFL